MVASSCHCLYNDGRARSIPRCPHCLADDHGGLTCPHNPNPPVLGWLQDTAPFQLPLRPQGQSLVPPSAKPPTSQEVCWNYNGADLPVAVTPICVLTAEELMRQSTVPFSSPHPLGTGWLAATARLLDPGSNTPTFPLRTPRVWFDHRLSPRQACGQLAAGIGADLAATSIFILLHAVTSTQRICQYLIGSGLL